MPYVIVKGKARLGTVVHKRTAAVVALQDVKSEDQRELATLVSAAKANLCVLLSLSLLIIGSDYYNSSDKYEEARRQWGGGICGNKSTQMLRKRAKAAGQSTTALTSASSKSILSLVETEFWRVVFVSAPCLVVCTGQCLPPLCHYVSLLMQCACGLITRLN